MTQPSYLDGVEALHSDLPLSGIKVLEAGQIYNGPYAGFLLAAAGADVVKVEPPGGERLRRRPPINGAEYPFMVINANKGSTVIDLKDPEGRKRFLRLAEVADVLIENFSTGTMDRLGVGYSVLSELNPGLIYASSTGYDPDGPYSSMLAMDLTVQAMSGMMSATGFPQSPPVKAGGALCDFLAGVHLYGGIVSALVGRTQTGRGRVVNVSMIDAVLPTLLSNIAPVMMGYQTTLDRTGNHHGGNAESPYNVYRASDGHVAIICIREEQWRGLVTAMDQPEMAQDGRFATNADRVRNLAAVDALVEAWTEHRSRAEITEILREADVPVAPVRTLREVAEDAELIRSGMLRKFHHRDTGSVTLMASPIRYGTIRGPELLAFPELGDQDGIVDKRWQVTEDSRTLAPDE